MKLTKNKKRKNSMDGFNVCNPMTIKDKFKYALTNKSMLICVDMQLNTGDFEFFVVKVQGGMFKLFGSEYLVNDKFLVWNRSMKMFVGKYHEDMSIPVLQHIPVKEIKLKLKTSNDPAYSRVINNIEPKILAEWNSSKVIRDTLKGQKMGDVMNKVIIMMWVIGIMGLISMLLILNMSGILGGGV